MFLVSIFIFLGRGAGFYCSGEAHHSLLANGSPLAGPEQCGGAEPSSSHQRWGTAPSSLLVPSGKKNKEPGLGPIDSVVLTLSNMRKAERGIYIF